MEQSRAAALTLDTAATTRTTRNTSDDLSWERARAISLAGGTAIYLVLDRPDIDHNIRRANRIGYEALIETVTANLNIAVMNSADKKLSSLEEPRFVWTVPYHEITQKSVRKDDMTRTLQDSEDQKCFSCAIVRLGDHVIDDE